MSRQQLTPERLSGYSQRIFGRGLPTEEAERLLNPPSASYPRLFSLALALLDDGIRKPGNIADIASICARKPFYSSTNSFFRSSAAVNSFLEELAASFLSPSSQELDNAVLSKAKAIIVDCDGVLWDGILGEVDRTHDLKVTEDQLSFQKALKKLKDRGFLLAICSKNNPGDIEKVLEEHPDMILRNMDFVVIRSNWQDKAANIRAIAEWMNIAPESCVFFDDSPQERMLVRTLCPEVATPDWPSSSGEFSELLYKLEALCRNPITEEDKKRTELYLENEKRRALRAEYPSIEDYYRALRIELTVNAREANLRHFERIAQLSERVTQFNMTGERYYSRYDLERLAFGHVWSGEHYHIYSAELSDVFGNAGVIGAIVIHYKREFPLRMHYGEPGSLGPPVVYEPISQIEAFFLSCRAIGFGVEKAFLSCVSDIEHNAHTEKLHAQFKGTNRNSLFKDFYGSMGFVKGEGAYDRWAIKDLSSSIPCPEWITVKIKYPDNEDLVPYTRYREPLNIPNPRSGKPKVKYVTCADKDVFIASKKIEVVRIEDLGCAGHTGDGEPIYGYNVYYYEA